MRFGPFVVSVPCGRWVSRGCEVGAVGETVASRLGRLVTCAFVAGFRLVEDGAPVFGLAGDGASVVGRSGRFLRALVLIFLRVRRAALRTSWAVASAHRRWIWGRTLV